MMYCFTLNTIGPPINGAGSHYVRKMYGSLLQKHFSSLEFILGSTVNDIFHCEVLKEKVSGLVL